MDPDVLADEARMNAQVRTEMAASGDDGSRERPVEHFAYPVGSEVGRKSFEEVADMLSGFGFSTTPSAAGGGIVATRTSNLLPDTFDTLTASLVVVLGEVGWQYDGWSAQNLGFEKD